LVGRSDELPVRWTVVLTRVGGAAIRPLLFEEVACRVAEPEQLYGYCAPPGIIIRLEDSGNVRKEDLFPEIVLPMRHIPRHEHEDQLKQRGHTLFSGFVPISKNLLNHCMNSKLS
jgi:hypothetical protein